MTAKSKRDIEKANSKGEKGVINYLPRVYMNFTKNYPEVSKAYASLSDSCNNAGPLDAKTQRLIKLGISIGINSEGAVRSHARRAIAEGISADEVRHVVLLGLTTAGFHHMMAAYKWVEEVLEKAD